MGKLTFKTGFGANDGKTLTKPFTYNGKTYNKITLKSGFGTNDGKVLNFGTIAPSIPTIKATEYTSMAAAGLRIIFTGLNSPAYDVLNPTGANNHIPTQALAIEFKTNVTVTVGTNGYLGIVKQTGNSLLFNTIPAGTYNFVGGKTYIFENGKAPFELVKGIPTLKLSEYSSLTYDTLTNTLNINGLSTSFINNIGGDANMSALNKDIIIEVKNTFSIDYDASSNSSFYIKDPVKNMGVYVETNSTQPNFTFVKNHNYLISYGKEPQDNGIIPIPITITNSQYTAIDTSYADSGWYALSGYTLADTTTQFTRLTLDIKSNLTIKKTTTWYDDGFSNSIFINTILSETFNLVAGHKYQFENGKDPVDLGTY